MKKVITLLVVLGVLSTGYYGLGQVYKQEMYNGAMAFEASLSELNEKTVAISVGDISYFENQHAGNKPSILLIHGFAAYKENWVRFARSFKDEFHVVVIDLPAHGKSVKDMDLNYSLTNQVGWVNEFVQAVGLTRFHIAGNSMGGAITAIYAAQYPQNVLTATLIDPAGVHDYRSVMEDLLDKGDNPLVVKDAASFKRLMNFALEQPPFIPWPLTVVSAERAIKLKPLHDKLFDDMRAGKAADFKAMLKRIEVPTLVQWGEEDRVINYKNIEAFTAHIPNVKGHVWPNVGHAPMIEIPQEAAQMMLVHMQAH
jgi:abhydrolase domain-containing protein 6